MKNNKISYSEWMKTARDLFSQLFEEQNIGVEDMLNAHIPNKIIDYKGPKLNCSSITTTSPGLKERFTEEWIDYYNDKLSEEGIMYDRLSMFISSVFHMGYAQCYNHEVKDLSIMNDFKKIMEKLKNENKTT